MGNKEKIKQFLSLETQKAIDDENANLIQKGILDSFTMIKLITFIEKEMAIEIKMEKLTPENFSSINTISKTISQWK